jgi:cytochrome c-type biogenesis protein CcmF
VTGRLNEGWLGETRRWTLFAWVFLTIGIVLGAWWSYQVLGWGGFWGWDPVENAALLPWLCGTAYLHSVMVQERRGLLRVWNLSLLIAAFSLTILGTFLTRSGVLVSVHSFSNSTVGPVLLGFFGVVVAVSVGLIAWRGDRLRSPGTIDAAVSREGAFLVNNLLFAGFALVVLLGTVFPLFVQAVNGQQVTVGRPYFDTMTLPIGFALLFFMAVAPALPWRKAAPGLLRRRLAVPAWVGVGVIVVCVLVGVRGFTPLLAFGLGGFAAASAVRQLVLSALGSHRTGGGASRALFGRANGGMVVHLGVVVVAVALAAASSYGQRTQLVLKPGQSVRYDGHIFTYVGSKQFSLPNKSGEVATVLVDGAPFYPAISVFPGSEGIGTPAVDSSVREDTYLTLADIDVSSHGPATIDVVIQPMVLWLWVGGAITAFGAVLAAAPSRRRRGARDRSATPGTGESTESPDGPPAEVPRGHRGGPEDPVPAPVGAGAVS